MILVVFLQASVASGWAPVRFIQNLILERILDKGHRGRDQDFEFRGGPFWRSFRIVFA